MGGIHASALPDEAKQNVDSVVIGEADYLWEGILDDYRNSTLKPRYKSEKLHDLKNMPVPRYDLVKKQYYVAKTLPVVASRGCPHNCEFCTVTKFFGNTYRLRPIDDVIRDIEMSGVKSFFFVDDNIIGNRKYAEELFTRLIPLKIRWSGQSTVTLGKFPDLCKLMAKSGCFSLVLGIESINQASLATFKPKFMSAETLQTKNDVAFNKVFSLRSIISRCIDQPRRCMLRSFVVNFITRKFMRKNQWLSGG